MARRPRWLILLLAAVASFVAGGAAVAAVALLTGEDADAAGSVDVAVATAGLVNDVSGLLQQLESPLVAADPAARERIARRLAAHERSATRLATAARDVGDEDTSSRLAEANAEIRAVARRVRRSATRQRPQFIAEVERARQRLDRVRHRVDMLVAELGEQVEGRPRRRLTESRSSLFDRPPIDLPHANLVLRGGREAQLAGASVSGAGDVNGDGRDDIVVAAPGSGDVYVVFGTPRGGDLRLDALGPDDGFAITGLPTDFPSSDDEIALLGAVDDLTVAGVGDLNDDDLDDIAIGAEEAYAGGAEAAGVVYVVYGSREGGVDVSALGDRGFRVEGPGPFWRVGRAVASGGDFDGDGKPDLLIGGREHFGSEDYTAAQGAPITWVLDGAGREGTVVRLRRRGTPGGTWRIDGVGSSIAPAGDVNGDGLGDVIAGDAYNRMLAPGYAAIVMGRRSGPARIDATRSSAGVVPLRVREGRMIGTAVAGIGDQNGDGLDDVAVLSRDLGMEARVHVVFGGQSLGAVELDRLERGGAELRMGEAPPDAEGYFGGESWSVRGLASAGDVNGDLRKDLLVAAPPTLAPAGGRVHGGARIVSGHRIRPGRRLGPAEDGPGVVRIDTFGLRLFPSEYGLSDSTTALSGVGDVDGDGLDDVALAAPAEPLGTDNIVGYHGAVYVAFRSPPGRGALQGLLSHNGMGQVAVGMPVPRAESLLDTTADIQQSTCGHLILEDSRIHVLVNAGSVARISITGPGLPSEAGVEVWDPVEAVEAAYDGQLERAPAEYYPDGFKLTARFGDGRKVVYTTDGTRVVSIAGGREPEVDYVEGCS